MNHHQEFKDHYQNINISNNIMIQKIICTEVNFPSINPKILSILLPSTKCVNQLIDKPNNAKDKDRLTNCKEELNYKGKH
jgi:hypothetical protein